MSQNPNMSLPTRPRNSHSSGGAKHGHQVNDSPSILLFTPGSCQAQDPESEVSNKTRSEFSKARAPGHDKKQAAQGASDKDNAHPMLSNPEKQQSPDDDPQSGFLSPGWHRKVNKAEGAQEAQDGNEGKTQMD